MRVSLILFCIQLMSLSYSYGNIDSLKNQLPKHPDEDTVRANILLELANLIADSDTAISLDYGRKALVIGETLQQDGVLLKSNRVLGRIYLFAGDFSKAIFYFNKGMVIAGKLKDDHSLGVLYNNKALTLGYMGEYDASLKALSSAIYYFSRIEDKESLARTLFTKGRQFYNLSQLDSALYYYQLSKNAFRQAGDTLALQVNNSIGVVYWTQTEYSKALQQFQRVLRVAEMSKDSTALMTVLGNMGLIQKDIGNYPLALHYQEKALAIAQKTYNNYQIASVTGNIGVLYDLMALPHKALKAHLDALKTAEGISEFSIVSSSSINAAVTCYHQKMYDEAMSYLLRAEKALEKFPNPIYLSNVYGYMGLTILKAEASLLKKRNISLTDRYAKALNYQYDGLGQIQEIDDSKAKSFFWNNIYEIQLAQENYKEALNAYIQRTLYLDSFALNDKKADIARVEAKYEYENKEAQLKAEHIEELTRQKLFRQYSLIALGVVMCAAGISFFFYKRSRDIAEKQKAAELQSHITETEMKALRAQMNPHFIFNALNSISRYITQNNSQAADDYLAKFARLMRNVLENSESSLISLEDDLKTLELYMQLEANRLDHSFDYEINIDSDIDTENVLVPPLIFQPYIENSIWHGVSGLKDKRGLIRLSFTIEKNALHCRIEDNGFENNGVKDFIHTQKQKSMGTKITFERIKIMNSSNVAIPVSSFNCNENGTVADIYLPLII